MADTPRVIVRWSRWGVWLLASATAAHEHGWISAQTYDRMMTFVYDHAVCLLPVEGARDGE